MRKTEKIHRVRITNTTHHETEYELPCTISDKIETGEIVGWLETKLYLLLFTTRRTQLLHIRSRRVQQRRMRESREKLKTWSKPSLRIKPSKPQLTALGKTANKEPNGQY